MANGQVLAIQGTWVRVRVGCRCFKRKFSIGDLTPLSDDSGHNGVHNLIVAYVSYPAVHTADGPQFVLPV